MGSNEPKWALAGYNSKYKIVEPGKELFDYEHYMNRMKHVRNSWKWPCPGNGISNEPLPYKMVPSDKIKELPKDTIIQVDKILYKGKPPGDDSKRGYFQAAIITEVETGLKGFMWLVYENKCAVESFADSEETETATIVKRQITNDELREGFCTNPGTQYELIFPTFQVRLNSSDDIITDEDKFTLTSQTQGFQYKKTLTIKDDKIEPGDINEGGDFTGPENVDDTGEETNEENENREHEYLYEYEDDDEDKSNEQESLDMEEKKWIYLHFVGTPTDMKYTLEVEPGKDKDGNKGKKYIAFENKEY